MGISFECGSCGKPFNVGVEFAGKTGRCKRCGATMQIPFETEPAPVPDDVFDLDEPVLPPRAATAVPARLASSGRPSGEPEVNQNIAAMAAQLRAGGKGFKPSKAKASASRSDGEGGFSWKKVGSGVLTVLVIMGVVGRIARPVRRAIQGQQANKPMTAETARQMIQTDIARYAAGPIALPRFPDLGPGEEREPGVTRHEVVFGPSPMPLEGPPGMGGKLWVYLPTGTHADGSLPAVLVTGAGSNLLTGMELGDADRKEHLPYVAAGFAVVAYEIDGMNHDETQSDEKMTEAMWRFDKARAGLINAHIALEYVLAKVPVIDPGRISAAGHSSAGALAVLFAETEPRLKSAVAYAPALNYARRFGQETVDLITKAGFGALVTRYAPLTGVADLKCPLLLFHARDDSNVPYTDTEEFVSQARADGKEVTLDLVATGDHYNSMIQEGIPHAIAWLKGQPIPTAEPTPPAAMPEPTPTAETRADPEPDAPAPTTPAPKNRERLEAARKKAMEARQKSRPRP